MADWEQHLSEHDRAVLERGRFARRMGFGQRAAVIVIACQNYMVGSRELDDERYPSRCGPAGWAAVDRIADVVTAARAVKAPVFYTRFVLDPTGNDIGVYGLKRDLLHTPYWCLADTIGAEIIDDIAPGVDDIVMVKKKPSAFHGTPLLGHLIQRSIDTLVIVGGATSNCVRATVFDAASHNYRAIVPSDCVFDRIEISHSISLFDMDRQFADVVESSDVLNYFAGVESNGA
ncbi:MAG: isochorismatase family protein [Rhodospirillaceae bacterium]|nr:isochorismatase family protein [Rhodospirillaceae bacterium]